MAEQECCKHCEQPITWDNYWTTWEHTGRDDELLYAELCNPALGFNASMYAEPK